MNVKLSFSYALITSAATLALAVPALAASDDLVEAARKEGSVTIYAATDQAQAEAALDAFAKSIRASALTITILAQTAFIIV